MLSEVKWPRKISVGKATVTVYKRTRANGTPGYEVANYSLGKRKFESFPNEDGALARAHELATQLSERAVLSTVFVPPRDLDSIRKHRKNIAELAAFHQHSAETCRELLKFHTETTTECQKRLAELDAKGNSL